jgi:peptide/nickel transport system permease protein
MTEMIVTPDAREVADVALDSPTLLTPVDQTKRRRKRPPTGVCMALGWLGLVVVLAICANLLPLTDPNVDSGHGVRVRPFTTWAEPFGTDSFGRSVMSRLVFGARVSLVAGVAAVLIALVLGLLFGITAGYFRGKWDAIVGLLIDSLLSIPAVILLLALASTLQPSLTTIIVGLALISFPQFTRLARATTLQFTLAEFVVASRGLGARPWTVLTREILPNVLVTVSAYAGVICAVLILAESTLSFLGLGVPQPNPSWGNIIADGRNLLQQEPLLVFVPVGVLSLTILSMNITGDWLRRRSDSVSHL